MNKYHFKSFVLLFIIACLFFPGFAFSSSGELLHINLLILQKRYEEALGNLAQVTESGDEKQKGRAYFLMGKIYKEQQLYQKAGESFEIALLLYPTLADYIKINLAEIYSSSHLTEKSLQLAQSIESPVLHQKAQLITIDSLIALDKNDEAINTLTAYTQRYDRDKEQKLRLAMLYKAKGNNEKAIEILKDIYIAARGLSSESLNELRKLRFRGFTTDELVKRGDNLLKMTAFSAAESTYKKALKRALGDNKDDVRFALAMCYFKTKRYSKSAETFALLSGPEPLFWRARSLYRLDRLIEYKTVIDEYGQRYGTHEKYGFLLLAYAQELMRRHEYIEAREVLKKVAQNFPAYSEDALWSLGWNYYKDRKFKEAQAYFSRLTSEMTGENLPRYLYWEARSLEKINGNFQVPFTKLKTDSGYYGFLARARLGIAEDPLSVQFLPPVRPPGKIYEVIEELHILNMDSEALGEISFAVNKAHTPDELRYLAHMSITMDNYPKAISIGQKLTGNESAAYVYPEGYWLIVKREAQRWKVDPNLVLAIIREESRFNGRAISPAGARGLMQLMFSTAQKEKAKAGVTIRSKADLLIPEKNIKLGIVHLISVLAYYNNHLPLAIASYNAGKVPVNQWKERSHHESLDEFIEDISYRETRRYVKTVLHSYWQYSKMKGVPPDRNLFLAITGTWKK